MGRQRRLGNRSVSLVLIRDVRLFQFLKYACIGGLNTGVSYLIYAACLVAGFNASLALCIGYVAGMGTSYVLNALWTFGQSPKSRRQFGRFILANVILLGLSEMLLHLILHVFDVSPYLGQAMNLVPMTLLGFYVNSRFVFQTPSAPAISPLFSTPPIAERHLRLLGWACGLVLFDRLLLLLSALWISQHRHLHPSWTKLLVTGYVHWDSGWYIGLSHHGYESLKQTAFFPAYPGTIWMLHVLTGWGSHVSAIVISLLAFVITLYFLGRYVTHVFGQQYAISTMCMLALFPTAFYFESAYTESLFLALALASVYYAGVQKFYRAAILAALATLTRNTGLLLEGILFIEWLFRSGYGWRFWRVPRSQKSWLSLLSLGLPILALGGYGLWLKLRFGDFLGFVTAEHYWHRAYMPPWQAFWHTYQIWLHPQLTVMQHQYVQFELGAFLLGVMMLAAGLIDMWKSPRYLILWIYTGLAFYLTASEPSFNVPDYLVSLPRYAVMWFPGFVYLAMIAKSRMVRIVVYFIFAALLFEKSALFFIGQWIA